MASDFIDWRAVAGIPGVGPQIIAFFGDQSRRMAALEAEKNQAEERAKRAEAMLEALGQASSREGPNK